MARGVAGVPRCRLDGSGVAVPGRGHAVVADAAQHLGAGVGEFVAERDRVVAGIEHEHRDVAAVTEHGDEPADLIDGGVGRVGCWRDAASRHAERSTSPD